MDPLFLVDDTTGHLLRRSGVARDEVYVNGAWKPTMAIIAWKFGQNNDLDLVTEGEARAQYPDAFSHDPVTLA